MMVIAAPACRVASWPTGSYAKSIVRPAVVTRVGLPAAP